MSFGTPHLNYLQRTGASLPAIDSVPTGDVPVLLRRLWQIHGVGVVEKQYKRDPGEGASPHMPTLDLLMGLYGFRVPVAFLIRGEPDRLGISIGTFMPRPQVASAEQAARVLSDRNQMVKAALQSVFRSVDARAADPKTATPRAAGMVLGIPTVKPPDPADGALPLDRLARALSGAFWGCLILAEPLLESVTSELRLAAVEELKTVQFYVKTLSFPDPMAEHYCQLLEATIGDYTYGMAIGAWRTTVYLTGDESSCSRLGAVWQGVFSGDRSLHMPIRISRDAAVPQLVKDWTISDAVPALGPGAFQHRFGHQTILTSDQLAAYIHLPRLETNGFAVSLAPGFDTVPSPPESGTSIHLGQVFHANRATLTPYRVALNSLTKHAFIAGVTGTGKTNTLLHLLAEADQSSVCFLVLEPAKTEYRALLTHPILGPKLRIYTLGNENVSPFRLNPFECVEGTPISAHIDMLRAAFGASFGMWTPLPQVLEQCFHAVYEDRGWDLASGRNMRAGANVSALAYPTLSELLRKVDEVTPTLGYDEKIASDIRAALKTRLNGLRAGGKGRMLDVRQSMPMEALFGAPTVLELEEMGDEDDKAFMMALVLIRVWEYQRSLGRSDVLRHILVVEEAHRVLANVSSRGAEESNARGKAVEAFANMLAEIRAYGEGVIIADQSPVRLAPDVIKNTNLKVAHRIVAHDDRATLAGAMAMTEQQSLALATLRTGVAALFKEGEDSPLLVEVKEVKSQLGTAWPSQDEVAHHMSAQEAVKAFRAANPAHPGCAADAASQRSCQAARALVEGTGFQRDLTRLVLSAFEEDAGLRSLWRQLATHFAPARRPGIDGTVLQRCAVARGAWQYADRRGASAGWSYTETAQFAESLVGFLDGLAQGGREGLTEFRERVALLSAREFPPYSHCERICASQPPTCLYRHDAAALVGDPAVRGEWRNAEDGDLRASQGRSRSLAAMMEVAERIVYRGDEGPSVPLTRAALCCSQLLLAGDTQRFQSVREIAMNNLLLEARASLPQEKPHG